MLEAVKFQHQNISYRVFYKRSGAVLPVLNSMGDKCLVPWGRRPGEEGEYLVSGWVPEARIEKGHFDFYFPKRVRIEVDEVLYRDAIGRHKWHPIPNSSIVGMLTKDKSVTRVYVVTVDAITDDLLDWRPKFIF